MRSGIHDAEAEGEDRPLGRCALTSSRSTQPPGRRPGLQFAFTVPSRTPQFVPHMGNLKKKRRLKMNKHKRRKRLKSNRHKKRTWQK